MSALLQSAPMPSPYELGWADGFRTDPAIDLCDWADRNVILSTVDSSEPGPYRTARTPYVREIANCLSPYSPVQRVVWQAGSQIGKTRTGLNWLGYIIDIAPGPTLFVQPTVDTAKRVSKQRLAPMLEQVPVLAGKISPPRERDSGNTILEKEFAGGIIIMAGANSAVGLRSMPARNLFLDEVDAYPPDVDGEGDPIALAERRSANFPRRKIFICSTPTIKGLSRIETEYLASDQRRFFVPCPHCGFFDWIRWENIRWPEGAPRTAQLMCVACSALIEERFKTQMLAAGEWRPTAKGGANETAGFHLSALYAPLGWKSWGELADEFLEASKEPLKLKTFVNTVLGETWEERGDTFDANDLKARLENYSAEVPHGVGLLTGSVDVQGDRLEWVVKGWGAKEESWLIAAGQVQGDPAKAATWYELDKMLLQTFTHESGRRVPVLVFAVDSGGLHTDQVYTFCAARAARRVAGALQHVYAIKGVGGAGREILARPSRSNRRKVRLWPIGVDTAKDTIFSRMHLVAPGPGYLHLPLWADDEYLAQLTSEKAVKRYKKGAGAVREYVKLRERNEALDLEVYALAALYMLGRAAVARLAEYAAALSRPFEGPPPPEPPDPNAPAPVKTAPRRDSYLAGFRRGKGWVQGWKR